MPKGYRREILATFIFIVMGFCLGPAIAWVLWPGSPELPTYGWEETAYSNYEPGGAGCQPSQLDRLPTNRERLRKREACEDSAEQYRIQTNDLKQQTRAADAAAASVWIAEWQSKATVFGLIVGFYTLAAAVAAAIFAKRASDETKRGADAAERAIDDSRSIGEAQARAYLTVTKAGFSIDCEPRDHPSLPAFKLKLEFRNSGQTPAVNVSYYCTAVVVPWRDRAVLPILDTIPHENYVNNITPDKPSDFEASCFGIAVYWREYVAGWRTVNHNTPFGDIPMLAIYGVVIYDDIFGKTFRSRFVFALEGHEPKEKVAFAKDDLPTLQTSMPVFEHIGSRASYIKTG